MYQFLKDQWPRPKIHFFQVQDLEARLNHALTSMSQAGANGMIENHSVIIYVNINDSITL